MDISKFIIDESSTVLDAMKKFSLLLKGTSFLPP